ncbi:MAG: alpha/beta hydrolase [Acholeplasmataceae bacterium]|nr:alpha/beta hydrolase [Acholeplasmataceae bacterium]
MATFTYDGRTVFYETDGEGEPILILNGIMMSTKSWQPFVESLSKNNRLIRLDFFDQGQTDRRIGESYTQAIQSDLILALLDHMNLEYVNLVGISYGGEVALMFASNHPERVRRLVVFNATAYTSPTLKEIGRQWNAIGRTRDGETYYKATIPVIYSPSYYEDHLEWMKKREALLVPLFSTPVFLDAMERLTNSAESFDVRDRLDRITAPTLIVAADEDYLTPVLNQRDLQGRIKGSDLVILPGSGHASMYEKPMLFMTLVLGYINQNASHYQI